MADQQILILDVFGDYVTFLENDIICTARRDEYIFNFTSQNRKGEQKYYILNDVLEKK